MGHLVAAGVAEPCVAGARPGGGGRGARPGGGGRGGRAERAGSSGALSRLHGLRWPAGGGWVVGWRRRRLLGWLARPRNPRRAEERRRVGGALRPENGSVITGFKWLGYDPVLGLVRRSLPPPPRFPTPPWPATTTRSPFLSCVLPPAAAARLPDSADGLLVAAAAARLPRLRNCSRRWPPL